MERNDPAISTNNLDINRWTLVFTDKTTERLYREDYFMKSLFSLRVAIILLSIIYALFAGLDLLTSSEFAGEFHFIRFMVVIPLLLTTLALSYFPGIFKKIWQYLMSFCYIVGGTGIAYMLLRNPGNIYYYAGMMLIFIGGYFFIKLYFRYATVSGFLVILLYNIGPLLSEHFSHLNTELLLITDAFFISANIIAAAALYTNDRITRREYLQRQLLSKKEEKIRLINETLENKVAERTRMLRERNQILRDEIAHRNKIENNLRVAKRKAEESDRLKSAFLANMSHEIRTPMNAIIGFLDLISTPDITSEEQAHFVSIIAQSGQRLLQTISDIVEISKIESEELQAQLNEVNLGHTFSHVQMLHESEARFKKLQLVPDGNYEHLHLRTDGTKLESILSNLIKNAIKFTTKGSISFGAKEAGNKLYFWVKDTGIGIPKNKQKVIFNLFTQADLDLSRGYEGSGLGLSICKAYVNLLGGEIGVESEPHKGSTFWFTIDYSPVAENNHEHQQLNNSKKDDATPSRKLVLVAEDDETSYKLMENILSEEDMEVIWAKNGEEAVRLANSTPDLSIIFMDIKMPLMDGIEATRAIRQSNLSVPIIAQTAFALSGDSDKALAAGCNHYLPKPIKRSDMVEMLKQYV